MAITEAQKRASAKYNAKAYDRIELKVKKGKVRSIENVCFYKNHRRKFADEIFSGRKNTDENI